jgi:nucleotide-binding universal stress UspA family protein
VIEAKDLADDRYRKYLERVQAMAEQGGVKIVSHVVVGHEVKSIVEFVKHDGFDLLVVGFMGHSALYDRVMGSTCQGLVRLAPCSVLVVK